MDEIRITRANNGYRCSWFEEVCEGDDFLQYEYLFEEQDGNELEAMKNLLWFIKEHFGVMYSKHNVKNLIIDIVENH